ncbi:MAG: hypothetical protein ACRYG8_23750 [Janthinobacterium lividum]
MNKIQHDDEARVEAAMVAYYAHFRVEIANVDRTSQLAIDRRASMQVALAAADAVADAGRDADAARYRWLRDNATRYSVGDYMNPPVIRVDYVKFYGGKMGPPPSLDAAIDAALAPAANEVKPHA